MNNDLRSNLFYWRDRTGHEIELLLDHFIGSGGRDVYDVTGVGQRFLVTSPGSVENSSPVTLVVNWGAEIKKK